MTNEAVDYPGRGQVEFSPRMPHALVFSNGDMARYVHVDNMGLAQVTEEAFVLMMKDAGFELVDWEET